MRGFVAPHPSLWFGKHQVIPICCGYDALSQIIQTRPRESATSIPQQTARQSLFSLEHLLTRRMNFCGAKAEMRDQSFQFAVHLTCCRTQRVEPKRLLLRRTGLADI